MKQAARGVCSGLIRLFPAPHRGRIHNMFGQKPHLKLIGAHHVADQQIVGPGVPVLIGRFGGFPGLAKNRLVRFEKARNLNRNFFAAARRTFDSGHLSHVVRHRHADPAQQLNSFGNLVHQLVLLLVMFVEKQMQLIERMPATCQ